MGKQVFQKFFVYVSVLKGALGGALGVDGGWLPLPNRPQRYCNLFFIISSLVLFFLAHKQGNDNWKAAEHMST